MAEASSRPPQIVQSGPAGPSRLGEILTAVPGVVGAFKTLGPKCAIF